MVRWSAEQDAELQRLAAEQQPVGAAGWAALGARLTPDRSGSSAKSRVAALQLAARQSNGEQLPVGGFCRQCHEAGARKHATWGVGGQPPRLLCAAHGRSTLGYQPITRVQPNRATPRCACQRATAAWGMPDVPGCLWCTSCAQDHRGAVRKAGASATWRAKKDAAPLADGDGGPMPTPRTPPVEHRATQSSTIHPGMRPALRAGGKRRIAAQETGVRRKDGAWLQSDCGEHEAKRRRLPLLPPVQRLSGRMTVDQYEHLVATHNSGTPECAAGRRGRETWAVPRLLHEGPGHDVTRVEEDADVSWWYFFDLFAALSPILTASPLQITIYDARGVELGVVRVRYGATAAAQAGVELLRTWRDGEGSDTNSRRGRKAARGSMTMFIQGGQQTVTTRSSSVIATKTAKLQRLLGKVVPVRRTLSALSAETPGLCLADTLCCGQAEVRTDRKLVVSQDYAPPTHVDPEDAGECAVVFGEDKPGAATNWWFRLTHAGFGTKF
eukprot:COSAG04_NODE_185_length_21024_cov_49.557276_9_plen_498_part_00